MNPNVKPYLQTIRVKPEYYSGASWEVVDMESGSRAWGKSVG